MINRGEVFEDLASELGLTPSLSPRAVVPWDFNGDGVLDTADFLNLLNVFGKECGV